MCHLLEQERQQHNQLKHTWQKANDQFLESQRLLMRDMQRMEAVLTAEQLRQVEELKKRDQVSHAADATPAPSQASPEPAGLRALPKYRVAASGGFCVGALTAGKELL